MNYSTEKPIVFSGAVKKQIISTDLVFGLYKTMADDEKLPKNSRKCIKRIENRINNIKTILYGRETLVLSKKDHKKYTTTIKRIQDFLKSIDFGLDFFNAILMIVEDTRLSAKKSNNKKLIQEWRLLSQSLNTLYCHIDPKLEDFDNMKLGENLGIRIFKMCN